MPLPLDPAMVATTDQLAGYDIVSSLGVVEGITTSPLISGFLERPVLVETMREAFLDMLARAAAHGAQAVVGLRYVVLLESRLVMAYGTAVKVRKL